MSIKPASSSVEQMVRGLWEKGLDGKAADEDVAFVEVYYPPKDLSNEFEGRRNELERHLNSTGKRLQTVQLFYYPPKENLNKLLVKGFFQSLGVQKIAFSKDPSQAIKEGFGSGNKILVCRCTLGYEGHDYNTIRGKYVLDNLKQVMVSYIVTFARPGESVSITPTDVFPEYQSNQQAAQPEEELVFHEAVVVRLAADDPHAKDVFGDASHANTTEEERILKHMRPKS
jgi:hypothetical protein